MCRTGFKLAYETPVAGFPWSIPFEFPLFQFLVAKISSLFGWGLERVGRLTSYAFLLACLFPISQIFKTCFARSWSLYFEVFTCLFLSSPLYLFWGRAFLVETAALFFSLCFLASAIHFVDLDFKWLHVGLSFLFLSLAMLQKSTTPLPMLAVLVTVVVIRNGRRWREIRFQSIGYLLMAFVAPLILGVAWVKYADAVKMRNPLGASLTSAGLTAWNFGTLSSRVSKPLWIDVILERSGLGISGLSILALPAGIYLLRGKQRVIVVLSTITFLSYFLIFENLHFTHDYYQTANGVYLISAVAMCVASLIETYPREGSLLVAALVLFVALNLYLYQVGYYRLEAAQFNDSNSDTLAVSEFIRGATDRTKPILVYGADWSSEFAFFSQRRSFTVPKFFPAYTDPIRNPVMYLGQSESAVVACGSERKALQAEIVLYFRPTRVAAIRGCEVFLRP